MEMKITSSNEIVELLAKELRVVVKQAYWQGFCEAQIIAQNNGKWNTLYKGILDIITEDTAITEPMLKVMQELLSTEINKLPMYMEKVANK